METAMEIGDSVIKEVFPPNFPALEGVERKLAPALVDAFFVALLLSPPPCECCIVSEGSRRVTLRFLLGLENDWLESRWWMTFSRYSSSLLHEAGSEGGRGSKTSRFECIEVDMEVEVDMEEEFSPASSEKAEIDIPSTISLLISSSKGDTEVEVSLRAGSGGTREWIMVCSLVSLSSFS
jgi:hypothetical protein